MITINAMFSRKVRELHKKSFVECKNVTGIRMKRNWDEPTDPDHVKMRKKIMKKKPQGDGWTLGGYALVKISDCRVI